MQLSRSFPVPKNRSESSSKRWLGTSLQWVVSVFGGDERIRTADFLRAKQALYQLSYVPMQET